MIKDIEQWKKDILFYGHIIQDDDVTVEPDEAEKRFNKYIQLIDCVEGAEDIEIAQYLIKSIQSQDDYGAYQSTMNKIMFDFSPQVFSTALINELSDLINRQPDWAGDFLSSIADFKGTENENILQTFNNELKSSKVNHKSKIIDFIQKEEKDGWLEDKKNVIKY
ncbi:MAG: hypothetical protein ACOCXW_01015 [Bacteroidota bacterium]